MALAFGNPLERDAVFVLEPALPPPDLREEFVQPLPASRNHVADDLAGVGIDPPVSIAGAPGEDMVRIDPAGTLMIRVLGKAARLPTCPIEERFIV